MKNGVRQRVSCKSIEEAMSVRAKLELTTDAMPADQWTLKHAFETVYTKVWAKGKNATHSYRHGHEAVLFFGSSTLLDAISTDKVDAWIARLEQIGNSNATINRKLATLSKIFSFAHHRNKVANKPHFERQSEQGNGRVRFLTQEEEAQVLELLSRRGKDCHAEAVCVLVDTGMRPSELWRLEGRDCDLDRGVVVICQTKNGKPRSVPMTQRVKDILRRRSEWKKVGPLFPHDNHWMEQQWDRAKSEMGLSADKQFVPYALRHTCASRLVQRRVPFLVVKQWMGHESIQMTERYSHLSPDNLFDAVKVLEAC
jgi:integrase